MGYWEDDGTYTYTSTNPPTLLAAGLQEQKVLGSGTITVTMWPIVVDTVFTTSDTEVPSDNRTAVPTVSGDGKPGTVDLFSTAWNVTWTVKQGTSGNGFADLLRAQKVIDPNAGEVLAVKSKTTGVRGDGLTEAKSVLDTNVTTGNTITLEIGPEYTSSMSRIGKGGSVYFNLEYVPFNNAESVWSGYDESESESVFDLDEGGPVWIIRNGVNDEPQNNKTEFSDKVVWNETTGKNGNGAVAFTIKALVSQSLSITDGKFLGPADSTKPNMPDISFITAGYTGTAEVWYAVVTQGGNPPDYSAYTNIQGPVAATTNSDDPPHEKTITLSGTGGYDVYVMLSKDGKVTNPVIIDTTKGDVVENTRWGGDPYYVASTGRDTNAGSKEKPLKTVQRALKYLKAAYADSSWPNKGQDDEAKGQIIIMDEAPVAASIVVDNTGSVYPSIVLSGDSEGSGGTLKAQASIKENGKDALLSLENNAKVTLEAGLSLTGTGDASTNIQGVYVGEKVVFTMNGGKIYGNSAIGEYGSGGGVAVLGDEESTRGTFIMNGGEIYGNSANSIGGGVYGNDDSRFTKTGGVIYGSDNEPKKNTAGGSNGVYGHAVNMAAGGTYSKNTTVGEEIKLYYNDSGEGTRGW